MANALEDILTIDYDQVMADYNHDLFHVLRGHHSLEFLETWVPDEDHIRSLLNMVEAAQDSGCDAIAIQIAAATAHGIDTAALEAALAPLGALNLERTETGLFLVMRELGGALPPVMASPFASVKPFFREAIAAAAAAIRHRGPLREPASGEVQISATVDGVTLKLLVDAEHRVRAAAFSGEHSAASVAVVDVLCATVLGLPIQEASDHGLLRVEARLRQHPTARPVAGIPMPENADPVFDLPQRLIRQTYAVYRRERAYRPEANEYEDPLTESWAAADDAQRLAIASEGISQALRELGKDPECARVLAVENDVRLIVQYQDSVPVADKPSLTMQLERLIKTRIDPQIQLFLAELKDENKLRRL